MSIPFLRIACNDIQTAHPLIQFLGPLISLFTHKRIGIVALRPNKDLNRVNELFRAGKLQCVLDRPCELGDVPEAIQLLCAGRHKGKVVTSVATLEGS